MINLDVIVHLTIPFANRETHIIPISPRAFGAWVCPSRLQPVFACSRPVHSGHTRKNRFWKCPQCVCGSTRRRCGHDGQPRHPSPANECKSRENESSDSPSPIVEIRC